MNLKYYIAATFLVLGVIALLLPVSVRGPDVWAEKPEIAEIRKPHAHNARAKRNHAMSKPLFQSTFSAPPPTSTQITESEDAVMAMDESILLRGLVRIDTVWRAELFSEDSQEHSWVEIGDAVNGWQVVDIRPNEVVIESDGFERTILLFQPSSFYLNAAENTNQHISEKVETDVSR